MPFIHFSTTKQLTTTEKATLSAGIAERVKLLPDKPPEKTMIRIDSGCEIYRNGALAECAFMETIFRGPLPIEAQREFVEALYALFKEKLGLDIPQVYFAMVDLETWGSRGTLS